MAEIHLSNTETLTIRSQTGLMMQAAVRTAAAQSEYLRLADVTAGTDRFVNPHQVVQIVETEFSEGDFELA